METSNRTLEELLAKSRRYGCEYGNALSNHLPMALIALQRLGANSQQLADFYSSYAPTLEMIPDDDVSIDASSWKKYLGQHQLNQSYRKFFINELDRLGVQGALENYLPQLMDGVSGGAFHPLIRLAYGIEIGSEWEIAEALASWCMAYQALGPIAITCHSKPPATLLEHLKKLEVEIQLNPVLVEGDTVFAWFKCVSESVAFQRFCSTSFSLDFSLPQIANAVIQLYLSTNDSFTALHCVTATHALRIVGTYLKDPSLNRFLWQAVCATYVIVKCPSIDEFKLPAHLPPWSEIFERARNQMNDHVIKFVYSSHCEAQHYQNPLYQLAAAQKVKLLMENS